MDLVHSAWEKFWFGLWFGLGWLCVNGIAALIVQIIGKGHA